MSCARLRDFASLKLTEPAAMAWTVGRLLARQGEPGEAEKLAAVIMEPPKGARYLMRGTPARMEHRHDGPRGSLRGTGEALRKNL
jgi:hypothetical protein